MTRGPEDILELIFTHTGQAELRAFKDPDEEGDGELVWSSDSDLDFKDEVSADLLSADADAERILVYLSEAGILEEDELPFVDILEDAMETNRDPNEVISQEFIGPDDDEDEDDDD